MLTRLHGAGATSLHDLGTFDAVVLGWGSLSHVRWRDDRVRTLRLIANVTTGPILISYATRNPPAEESARVSTIKSLIPARFSPEQGTFYWPNYGLFHKFTADEIAELAADAGLDALYISPNDTPEYGHAVLHRPTGADPDSTPE